MSNLSVSPSFSSFDKHYCNYTNSSSYNSKRESREKTQAAAATVTVSLVLFNIDTHAYISKVTHNPIRAVVQDKLHRYDHVYSTIHVHIFILLNILPTDRAFVHAVPN